MEENTTFEIISDEVITIEKSEYDELRRKMDCFDILAADIKMNIDNGERYSYVDTDLVMLLTGMKAYLNRIRQKDKAEAEHEEDDGK